MHEFRALALFALGRYDEAAPALHSVLAVEPGWDWTTLISLYHDPEKYTQQLRALEDYKVRNPKSAPARFVLAYHYLTAEHAAAAVGQYKVLGILQPNDALSAQLIRHLEPRQQPVAALGGAQPQGSTTGARKLEGTWTTRPRNDVNIDLTFQEGGALHLESTP